MGLEHRGELDGKGWAAELEGWQAAVHKLS